MEHGILTVVFAVVMAFGLVGVVLPVVPGIPLMFVVALVAAVVDRFTHITGWQLAILGGLTVLSVLVDHLSGLLGARYGGASGKASLYGTMALIAGTLILPPFGGVVAMFVTIIATEASMHADMARAWKAAGGSLAGYVAGIGANLGIGIMFVILFVIFYL